MTYCACWPMVSCSAAPMAFDSAVVLYWYPLVSGMSST